MHDIEVRQEIIDRVLARRGRYHMFDQLDPARTAHLIIDMQNMFVKEGAPAEVPVARDIVGNINDLNAGLRELGVRVIWVTHANTSDAAGSDWRTFFDYIVSDDKRERTMAALKPEGEGQQIWHALEVDEGDTRVVKNRYSALIPGSSQLERILRAGGTENVLISGTKTDVCCESTGRDAMMMDFRVVMVSDCMAALSDDEHRATLETMIQQFGDVMTHNEVLAVLRAKSN